MSFFSFSPLPSVGALLSIAMLFSHANLGMRGLLIPTNSLIWIVVGVVLLGSLYVMLKGDKARRPAYLFWLLACPGLIMLSGMVSGLDQPVDWFMRVVGLLLGVLFFLAMFQFRGDRRAREDLLGFILLGLCVQGIIGLAQLFAQGSFPVWIPYINSSLVLGMFQQVNVMASAMATAAVLSVWLVTLPSFSGRSLGFKLLPFVTLFISVLIVFSSGSRVGLLGLMLALGLILFARLSFLKRRKSLLAGLMFVLLAGFAAGFASGDGVLKAYSKVERLAAEGADVRPHIYRISWQLFTEKPLTGHGIGSFQRVFHERAAEYMQQRPGIYIGSAPYTHPHNELLYWMVEGGALALGGILLAVGAVVVRLVKLGWQRGMAMAALLAPLGMHALVEWPFYVSAYHWILLMLLLFIAFAGRDKHVAELKISMPGRRLLAMIVVMLVIGVWGFCGTAYYYSGRIMQVLYSDNGNLAELQTIRKHPYFTRLSNAYLLRALFYHERSQGQLKVTPDFIQWAEDTLYHVPEAGLFRDLIRAYLYMGKDVEATEQLIRAQTLFPGHVDLEKVALEVLTNDADGE